MPDEEKQKLVVSAIRDLGFPIFTSIALGFVVYVLGSTMIERQNKFIDSVESTNAMQAKSIEKVAENSTQLPALLQALNATFTTEHSKTREVITSTELEATAVMQSEHGKTREALLKDGVDVRNHNQKEHEKTREAIEKRLQSP